MKRQELLADQPGRETETRPVLNEDYLEKALAVLGYPGFAHLARFTEINSERSLDPAVLLHWAIAQDVLDVRLIEGLPWLIAVYAVKIDWNKLINNAQKHGVQNRLGYLVYLALKLAESKQSLSNPKIHLLLKKSLLRLQEIRQSKEQTLMEEWSGPALRAWMRVNRPQEALEWHILTTLTTSDLQHAE